MINYNVLQPSPRQLAVLEAARLLVDPLPARVGGRSVRCHELSRAVGMVLGLKWIDGRFGLTYHSWLIVPADKRGPEFVLDVHTVGAVPQVQLCDISSEWLRGAREYRDTGPRDDIDDRVVTWLCRRMLGDVRARLRGPRKRRGIVLVNPRPRRR